MNKAGKKREGGKSTHLKVGILARPQSAHPQIRQYNLTAGMCQQGAMIGCHGKGETTLIGPRVQLAGEQTLCLLRILAVAEIQQFVACNRKAKRVGN